MFACAKQPTTRVRCGSQRQRMLGTKMGRPTGQDAHSAQFSAVPQHSAAADVNTIRKEQHTNLLTALPPMDTSKNTLGFAGLGSPSGGEYPKQRACNIVRCCTPRAARRAWRASILLALDGVCVR
jgi:hypothetical protein